MGKAKELTALGLVPCLSPAEAVPPEKLPHPAAASYPSLLPLVFAWTLICHLHLLSSLAGSHHQNSLNQLGWNIVGPFPWTRGWFSHRAEPIWQLAALPSSLRLQPASIRDKWDPQVLPWDPHSPGALQRHSSGSSQTEKKPYQQKLFCHRGPWASLGWELLQNRSRTTDCTGSAASANQQTWGTLGWSGPPAPHSRAVKPASHHCQATPGSQPAGHQSTSLVLSCKEVLTVDGPWKDSVQLFSPVFAYSNTF